MDSSGQALVNLSDRVPELYGSRVASISWSPDGTLMVIAASLPESYWDGIHVLNPLKLELTTITTEQGSNFTPTLGPPR